MPVLVSSNWAAWLIGAGSFFLTAAILFSRTPKEDRWNWKKTWSNIAIGLIVAFCVQVFLFCWSTVQTIYDDHHDSTGRWAAVVNEKNSLKGIVATRDQHIWKLESDLKAKTGVVEKTRIIQEPKQCYADSVTEGKNPAGHGLALIVVRCNYEVKVPLRISLEVDRPIANFNFQGIIPERGDLASQMSEFPGKDGDRSVWVDIGTLGIPSLPANRLVKFAVESTTSDFPAPVKGTIESK